MFWLSQCVQVVCIFRYHVCGVDSKASNTLSLFSLDDVCLSQSNHLCLLPICRHSLLLHSHQMPLRTPDEFYRCVKSTSLWVASAECVLATVPELSPTEMNFQVDLCEVTGSHESPGWRRGVAFPVIEWGRWCRPEVTKVSPSRRFCSSVEVLPAVDSVFPVSAWVFEWRCVSWVVTLSALWLSPLWLNVTWGTVCSDRVLLFICLFSGILDSGRVTHVYVVITFKLR